MKKNCKTCAWYCHSNGKCYGTKWILDGREIGLPLFQDGYCKNWSFDGLEEWERD